MDNLVKGLRGVDHRSVEDCFLQSPLFEKAADRITQLEADLASARAENERLRLESDELDFLRHEGGPQSVAAIEAAAKALIGIVEGIQGALEHGTWRDEKGQRLNDTPEWVAFYAALASEG